MILVAKDVIEGRHYQESDLGGIDGKKIVMEILPEAGDLERAKEAWRTARIGRPIGASKKEQMVGIET